MFALTDHRSRMRTILLGLSIWSIIAIIAATTAFIALKGDQPAFWFSILKPMLVYYYLWGLFSIVIFRLTLTTHSLISHPVSQILLHLAAALTITAAQARITHPENWQNWMFGERAAGFWLLSCFIYLFILITALLVKKNRQLRAKEMEMAQVRLHSSQLENQLNLAQMDALKMQINPHFLFNALNSIAALIELDCNKKAYYTTELLGDLLRSTLTNGSESLIPLAEELTFVGRYIELEKVRFDERFNYHEHISEQAKDAKIPALILQPLVENTFKHGVAKTNQTVEISLTIVVKAQMLHIELQDNAPAGQPEGPVKDGYGLYNIRKRLQLLFENQAQLNVCFDKTGGCTSQLIIPFNT